VNCNAAFSSTTSRASFDDNVRKGLSQIQSSTPQLPKPQPWFALVCYIGGKFLTFAPKPRPGLLALEAG
jgi:hypothetical protein